MTESSQTQTQSTNQTSVSNPWAPQASYLTQAFQGASDALKGAQGQPLPPNYVAQFNPEQLGAFQTMLRFGMGNPNIAQSNASAGGALTQAGSQAATAGLFGLANFQPTTGQDIVNNTRSFANNPEVQGMVDAATRDARRAVYEHGMPQIARNAALTGNTNSSRTGVREGILERGLADTVADTSAAIRGRQYETGLSAALDQARMFDANRLAALSGASSGGSNAVGTGVNANLGAVSGQQGLYDIANQAIGNQQQAGQASIDDALKRYAMATQNPFDLMSRFYSIVGGNNWGGTTNTTGTTTGTKTNTPSTLASIGAAAGILGSFI